MRSNLALLAAGAALVASHGVAAETKKAPAIDPMADELLHKMSDDLSSMKAFTFDSNQVMEVVTKEGEKIQGLAETHVSVERPNKLRADRLGKIGAASIYYDGANLTIYGHKNNMYATAKAPNNLDEMIDFARDQLSLDAPGADLLHSNVYKVLMEDAVSGRYLGEENVGDRSCHHLAYRGHETDWQIWIADGADALPCRFVITSKKVKGEPEFTVNMSNFKEQRGFDASTFSFTPPPNAAKIDFIAVSDQVQKQKRQARR